VDPTGRIFAVGRGGLNILDEKGAVTATWLKDEDLRCIALAEDATLYVASASRIIKLDSEGRQLAAWTPVGPSGPQLGSVPSLTVKGMELLAGDADARCVHRLTIDGDLSNNIPAPTDDGKTAGKLILPSAHLDALFDLNGNVIINHPGKLRVEVYSLDGKLRSFWGEPGMAADRFCGCCNPTDIALAPDGNIITAEKGILRVKLYSPEGKMLAFIGPEYFSTNLTGAEAALDLAVDGKGRIFIADPGDGKIRVFTPTSETASDN